MANGAIENDPTFARGWVLRGDARRRTGQLALAIDDFAKARELEPGNADACVGLALSRAARGSGADAIADFDRALELEPKLRAALRTAEGRVDGIDGLLADLVREERGDGRLSQAYLERARGRAAKATERDADVDLAIDLHPNAAALALRGRARLARKDFAGAIADTTAAIELDSKLDGAWFDRGEAREGAGDAAHAFDDFSMAIGMVKKDDPSRAAAYLARRAHAYERAGDAKAALQDLERAITLAPPLEKDEGETLARLRAAAR
jgi:tetratricopeptide (TPR) repeat protein